MSGWGELFAADFLLRHALWGAVAVGLFCPLVGAWFTVRRMILLGVTLPLGPAIVALSFAAMVLLHAGRAAACALSRT